MAYFPLFFDIADQKITIIGAGSTAYAKARRLTEWNCRIEVIDPDPIAAFETMEKVTLHKRKWDDADLDGSFLVIAATADPAEDTKIAERCRQNRILCNAVDQPAISTAIFGALIHEQELCIGISTAGASPSAAQYLKKKIRSVIPENFDEILQWLHAMRPMILRSFDEKKRAVIFHRLFDESMKKQDILSLEEVNELLEDFR